MKRLIAAIVAIAAVAYGFICLLGFEAGALSGGIVWLHIIVASTAECIALKSL
jgi:hypothetical protein